MTIQRFSRTTVAAEIEGRIRALREEWPHVPLDASKGHAQVARMGEGGPATTQAEIATRFGVTRQAVSLRERVLRGDG